MIYHVTGSGFLRKFGRGACIVAAVAAVAAAEVEAVASSGEKLFFVICRKG